jgi:hypothetical protein
LTVPENIRIDKQKTKHSNKNNLCFDFYFFIGILMVANYCIAASPFTNAYKQQQIFTNMPAAGRHL